MDTNRKHYLAVFDPDTNEVDVVEVPKVNMHQNLREVTPEREAGASQVCSNVAIECWMASRRFTTDTNLFLRNYS